MVVLGESRQTGGDRSSPPLIKRWGKDEIALHWTACALHERVGVYWHMLPQASQARKAIWEAINPHTGQRRIDEAFPKELRKRTLNNEMFIEFKCGSTWQVVGSDNFNSLVGSPPIGLVSSEHALSNPKAWSYLRPILVENGGWAIFISTYRGKNHFWELGEAAKDDPNWYFEVSPVSKTKAVDAGVLREELDFMTREMGRDAAVAMYNQEWECDPDAAIQGSFYAGELSRAVAERRISHVPFDSVLPVYTYWDLGLDDATAIWWAQFSGKEIRLIKYREFHEPLQAVATQVMEIGQLGRYAYKSHVLPHDAAAREMTTGRTREQALRGILGDIQIMPQDAVADGINAVRSLLDRMWFDERGTKDGVEALKNYCRDYDEKNKVFRDRPLHNWASHGSDAIRQLALHYRENIGITEQQAHREQRYGRRGGTRSGWVS